MSLLRSRVWLLPLLVSLLLVGVLRAASGASGTARLGDEAPGFLVSEAVTGAASASDEFIELYNAGSVELDLNGLELVYASASGATVSRRAEWTEPTPVAPARHVLIANAGGAFAEGADATYASGLSATGGTLALRPVGGPVIDSLSWGEATGPLVEGAPGAAPPPGSSLERLPGGALGNGRDTGNNAADTWIQPEPVPQSLADPPTPPLPDPTPSPSATGSASPTPSMPTASATSGPIRVSVAEARALPPGTSVEVAARLTTPLGLLASGTLAFAQDDSAGIALELASADWPALSIGSDVLVRGRVEDRLGQRTVVLVTADDLQFIGSGPALEMLVIETGAAGEELEGQLVRVRGLVGEADPPEEALSVSIDDGSGALVVVIALGTGIGAADVPVGADVELTGVLGQRDASGEGVGGYRLYPRERADLMRHDPVPTATPTTMPPPTPRPTATPRPTQTPIATPTPQPVMPISEARAAPIGTTVTVRGTVTVDPGRLLADDFFVIQDKSGGIGVRAAADDLMAGVRSGQVLRVTGKLADPYGNQELRPATDGVVREATDSVPRPVDVTASQVTEEREGRLLRLSGTIERVETGSSGSFALTVRDGSGEARVYAFGTTGISRDRFEAGQRLRAIGIGGQRESSSDAGDGHRLWPRSASDLVVTAPPPAPTPRPTVRPTARPSIRPSPRPSLLPHPTPPPIRPTVSIASALRQGGSATVQGAVTAPAGLLDADGRRVTIQDASGALLLRLPEDRPAPALGTQLRVSGTVGTYYGAPQLEATGAPQIVGRRAAQPQRLSRPPAAADEWQLVSVSGTVMDVSRNGSAWRAELQLAGGGSLPVAGLAASRIPSTALVEGRSATVTGLVRRAYPTASDQRYTVVPRSASDVRLVSASPSGSGAPPATSADPAGGGFVPSGGPLTGSPAAGASGAPGSSVVPGLIVVVARLADLSAHVGQQVQVGGRVAALTTDTITIDDETGRALLRIGEAPIAPDLAPGIGQAINAVGIVAPLPTEADPEVLVASMAQVIAAPNLGSPAPAASAALPPAASFAAQAPTAGQPAIGVFQLVLVAGVLLALAGTALVGILLWQRRRAPTSDHKAPTEPRGLEL